MIRRTRTRFAALTAAALAALAVGSQMATAAPNPANQSGGAAGVVAAVVQVQNTLNNLQVLSNNGNVEIVTVKDSLNNVLQNAHFLNNITVLQNFLNGPCAVAGCITLTNLLNNNNVNVSRVVAISILSGGDVIVFQQ